MLIKKKKPIKAPIIEKKDNQSSKDINKKSSDNSSSKDEKLKPVKNN